MALGHTGLSKTAFGPQTIANFPLPSGSKWGFELSNT